MKKEEYIDIIKSLKEEISLLIQENKDLIIKNENMQDEIDSLWAMMDEITKSDIQNFSHILDELKADVITRSLMVTKKVADA
jgi:regulator of replication initiation timing